MAISFELTEEQKKLQKEVRDFVRKEIIPRAREIDEKQEVPKDLLEKALKPPIALPSVWIPKEYGGKGLDKISICLVSEEVGYGCGSFIPLVEAAGLGTLPILLEGSETLKQKYLPGLAKGEKYPSLGMTERNAGSDAGAVETKAEKTSNGYVINGEKTQISEVDIASHFVVSARTDPDVSKGARGVSLIVVDKDSKGIEIGRRFNYIGTRGHKAYQINFKDVEVPAENLIGEENKGFRGLMRTLDETRLSLSAALVGLAKAAYEIGAKHAVKRKTFGKTLIENQSLGFKLAEIATRIEATRLLALHCAWLSDQGVRHTKNTSMAKLFANEVAVDAALLSIKILGGYGVMEGDAEYRLRDSLCFLFAQGTPEIQKIIIARDIGKEFAE